MPNKKITELPTASTPQGTELFECVQGGINKKITLTDSRNYKGKWSWPGGAAPTANAEGDYWLTDTELSDPFVPKWSHIHAKFAGANTIDANPDTSQFIVK